jgi:geranylgeranyl reductase family protein
MIADVLVVGAGPAGSVAAIHLARAGRDVLLVDAATFPRPKACAEYASPAIADELARLGIAGESWQRDAVPIGGMRLIRDGSAFDLRYADRAGRRRPAWGVDRLRFDALLATAAATAGAALIEGRRVVAAQREADHWRVTVRGGSTEETLAARWLVGADGTRSRVARLMGVERSVVFPRRLGLIAHYEGNHGLTTSGEMHVGPGSTYVGLAPMPGGRLNVGMALPLPAGASARSRYEAAIAALPKVAARLRNAQRVTPIRGAAPIGHRVARAAGDGWLLVGDAAGFVDPFTGEGIYRALRSGRAAATAIATGDPARAYLAERRRAFAAKDALTWLVQGMLAAPPILGYAARRLDRRDRARLVLGGALGDCRPASDALAPGVLIGALWP